MHSIVWFQNKGHLCWLVGAGSIKKRETSLVVILVEIGMNFIIWGHVDSGSWLFDCLMMEVVEIHGGQTRLETRQCTVRNTVLMPFLVTNVQIRTVTRSSSEHSIKQFHLTVGKSILFTCP
jgi:hypothetical protein